MDNDWGYWLEEYGERRWCRGGTRAEAETMRKTSEVIWPAGDGLRRGPVQRASDGCPFGKEDKS